MVKRPSNQPFRAGGGHIGSLLQNSGKTSREGVETSYSEEERENLRTNLVYTDF